MNLILIQLIDLEVKIFMQSEFLNTYNMEIVITSVSL